MSSPYGVRMLVAFVQFLFGGIRNIALLMLSALLVYSAWGNVSEMKQIPDVDWSNVPAGQYRVDVDTERGRKTYYRDEKILALLDDTSSTRDITLRAYGGNQSEYLDALTSWAVSHGGALRLRDQPSGHRRMEAILPAAAADRLEQIEENPDEIAPWVNELSAKRSTTGQSLEVVDITLAKGRGSTYLKVFAGIYFGVAFIALLSLVVEFGLDWRNRIGRETIEAGRIWA